jgi:protein-disulfide isomerase
VRNWNCGLYCGVVMPLVPSRMEDTMCWEIDYKLFAEQKKAQEARVKQEQRPGVIDQLLNDANKQGEKRNVEATPVKEVAPAK